MFEISTGEPRLYNEPAIGSYGEAKFFIVAWGLWGRPRNVYLKPDGKWSGHEWQDVFFETKDAAFAAFRRFQRLRRLQRFLDRLKNSN